MHTINIESHRQYQFIDLTAQIRKLISDENWNNGICIVYTPHTTAAITINENADPDVKSDFIKYFKYMFRDGLNFEHGEENSPAHILSSMFGCSQNLIISNQELVMGTWQAVYFLEFDGPRKRKVYIDFVSK